MPRCNLSLKQKSQIIELSGQLSTEQLAKKFRVHPTTVTRTLRKKEKILFHVSRVNVNFKTVQTNQRNEELDTLVLEFIRTKQAANERLTAREICNKAVELAKTLDREVKTNTRRSWWRRFKIRCNIVKSRFVQETTPEKVSAETPSLTEAITPATPESKTKTRKNKRPSKAKAKKRVVSARKRYTYKIRESNGRRPPIKKRDMPIEQSPASPENNPTPSQ